MMWFYLEEYENKLIDDLKAKGISHTEAFISIFLYFRDISRPIDEMPAILSRYSPVLSESAIRTTFDKFCNLNLIVIDTYGTSKVYKTADDYERKLEQYTGIVGLADELTKTKSVSSLGKSKESQVIFEPRGVVSAEGNYATLLSRLEGANNSIKAAILCSAVYEDTAAVFEKMANKGVHVQILIASDELVKKCRGSSVQGRYNDWKKRLQNIKNIEIQQFSNSSAAELCSSYLIDDSVLRLVIFDYATMPSLQGYLVEVVQKSKTNINLVHWYKTQFDKEWIAAKQANISPVIKVLTSPITLSLVFSAALIALIIVYKIEGLLFEIMLILLGIGISYLIQIAYKFLKRLFKDLSTAMKEIRH